MTIPPFVGRQNELQNLGRLLDKKTASLVVIKGRRRIGKSRLVEEFSKNKKFLYFSGIPPTPETTAQSQRDEFARQLSEQLEFPALKAEDWGGLFTFLASQTKKSRVIIFLDEISWMGSKDPTFLGKLKLTWDTHFKKNPKLILILCGSMSSWIEKNIISNTGFLGRISLKITLEELSLPECNILLELMGFKGSVQEKFMILSVIGGVPWYIELINPGLTATENIKELCFTQDGILVGEFKNIFHDLFGRRRDVYKKIVEFLANGPSDYNSICNHLNYPSGGPLSEYLEDLEISEFISQDHTWTLGGKEARLRKYRLRDNYLRFYLKYIHPNLHKITRAHFQNISLSSFPGWESIMGFQFENLVLNNRALIYQKLGLRAEEVVYDNPFFQTQTKKHKGLQIDYLIQTKFGNLYICEIKFSRNSITRAIIKEMEHKISALKYPKGFACLPVLIHINGVTSEVKDSSFFAKIIDFGDLLHR